MAEILYGLILIPFSLLDSEENQFCKDVLLNLTESFLAEEFSEQVDYFIVPALAHEKSFPYSLWNKVLSQNGQAQKTPWLLYSFLKLGMVWHKIFGYKNWIINFMHGEFDIFKIKST